MNTKYWTIRKLQEALLKKEFTAVELAKETLKRTQEIDKEIKAFLKITPEKALEQAKEADRLLESEKEPCWLTGIPFGVKDIIVTKDIETTAGSRILQGFVPPYNATVYDNLISVKGVTIGKLNLDEFAMGASTENSAYQKTKNPWNKEVVPGGSSGGSAASVASGEVPFSLGTDTGGSIRQPASFNNVVGLKPTYGRVSRYGLIPLGNSLDQAGPITRTVEDAALVLGIIAGYDPKDATSVKKPLPDFSKNLEKSLKNKVFGVPKEYLAEGIDKEVLEVFKKDIKIVESLGGKIEDISLPRTEQAVPVYYLIMSSEVSTNLSRYDGVRFGHSRETFGPETKRRIMLGTYALSSGYYDAYYLKAAKVRRLIFNDFQEAFKKVDFIIGPTSPILPFKFGEKTEDPLAMYLADVLTVPQNLAGLPAISIPGGFANGLPVGFQITANHWQEEDLLSAAFAFEQETAFYKETPQKV